MRLQLLTSNSSILRPISDFRYLCELARCSKCQTFIALKSTNKLYGGPADAACIHEIDIPYELNTDLTFRTECIDKNILQSTEVYYIPEEFPWVILPDYTYEEYRLGKIKAKYLVSEDLYVLYSGSTRIPQIQMLPKLLSNDYVYQAFNNELEGFLSMQNLSEPYVFTDVQNMAGVRKVFDNKVSLGSVYISLPCININGFNRNVTISLYKGLFALAKNDQLDIVVRFSDISRIYTVTFIPNKKKNPISYGNYHYPFKEKIHIKCIDF